MRQTGKVRGELHTFPPEMDTQELGVVIIPRLT